MFRSGLVETKSRLAKPPSLEPTLYFVDKIIHKLPLCMAGGKKKAKKLSPSKIWGVRFAFQLLVHNVNFSDNRPVWMLIRSDYFVKNWQCAVHRLSFCVKWISREFLQCYNTTSSTIVKYNYRTGGSYCWSLMTKYVLTWKTSPLPLYRDDIVYGRLLFPRRLRDPYVIFN